MTRQLALNLRLRDGSSFENYYVGDNAEAVEALHGLLVEPPAATGPASLYLWGESEVGKTHLLEAACRRVQSRGATALYVPLAFRGIGPAALENAERAYLICVDDAHRAAGNRDWEAALFTCYEMALTTGARFVVAATAPPMQAGFAMPDLRTRFAGGGAYPLRGLSDDAKLAAIQLRARNRGFDLATDVGRYILNRYPRDLGSLFALLDRIDAESLAHQRRITIPFLRELESTESES